MRLRRARFTTVLLLLAAGALLLIASTQPWFVVVLRESPDTPLDVSGSAAVPVLAPLALAALAVAAATSIAGRFLSYAAAVLAMLLGLALTVLLWAPSTGDTAAAISPSVTEATGIAGADAVAALVRRVEATAWPLIALVLSLVVFGIGLFAIATAHAWPQAGRRYRTDSRARSGDDPARGDRGGRSAGEPDEASAGHAAPLDAIDSWDDLSHGSDPTR
ncbi:Trp biosynthesis-associated membrane protein [Microbacterium lacus]|uniref:Trp biosynthesis-associated membrane protein n=1 Tax=Microbacterium lacus TaxID=415217 RepID=UPI000C2C4A61|nr:Trp biosynthesis-associated membrane protein [Microbacterium lacus]